MLFTCLGMLMGTLALSLYSCNRNVHSYCGSADVNVSLGVY